jgi:hypothetical protein
MMGRHLSRRGLGVRFGSNAEVGAGNREDPQQRTLSARSAMSEKCHVWTAPIWQELFSRFAALVGAAMCSAFKMRFTCVDGSDLARAFFAFCSIGRCSHVFGL